MRQSVILAAGRGSRMSRLDADAKLDREQTEAAEAGSKALMPVNGRPFLDFVLRELAGIGIERCLLVVAPGDDALGRRYSRSSSAASSGTEVSTVVQQRPLGTADALLCCRQAVGREPFLLINSDNFYPATALAPLAEVSDMACLGLDLAAVAGSGRSNLSVNKLSAWACLEVDRRGFLIRIVEKPTPEDLAGIPQRHLASPNAWRLTPEIFDACESICPSGRGEYELADAVQYAIETMRCRVRVLVTRAPILDLSTRGDVASVARLLPDWNAARAG